MTRRHLAMALKIIVSVTLVGLLMRAVGAGDAVDRMAELRPQWMALAVLLGVVQVALGGLRWRAVLVAIGAPMAWRKMVRFLYIGAFFNQTLPSSVGGDAVRGYLAYRGGLGVGPAVNSVILDRVATVLALAILVAVMTLFGTAAVDLGVWFVRVAWIVLALAMVGILGLMVMDRLVSRLQRFRLAVGLGVLAGDARRTFLQPLQTTRVMGWSILGHVNLSLIVFVLAKGLGVEVTLIQCLLLFPPVLLAQTLPLSVAGWGVREGAMVALFGLVGVGGDSALAISILYGLVMIIVSLPGAALWLGSGAKTIHGAQAFAKR